MKKATKLILAIFFAFICVVLGVFIGRLSVDSSLILYNEKNAQQTTNIVLAQNTTETQFELGKISINTATSSQLQMLPNIGEVLASRIIEYRTQNGPFVAIEDLLLVEGIGEKRLDELRQYITLGG